MKAIGQLSAQSFAATWRDEAGAVVGTSHGGTVCWFPVIPGRLRIVRDDFQGIVRCRECPGCFELDRRRLAERLDAKYGGDGSAKPATGRTSTSPCSAEVAGSIARLWMVRVYCEVGNHAKLAHQLHRYTRFQLEPGFARLGPASIAVISRSTPSLREWLRTRGLRFWTKPIKLGRRRRAWRSLTAGLAIARDKYGENLNRFYFRGLPQLAREKWEVVKHPYETGYDRRTSPRAWKRGKVVLVPPEAWRLGRLDRRKLRMALRAVADPDQLGAVTKLAAALASARSLQADSRDPSWPILSREQVEAFYVKQRERVRRRREAATFDSFLPPLSEEGAYVSSAHTQSAVDPVEAAAAATKEAIERIRMRQPESLISTLERLKRRIEEREGRPLPAADQALAKLRARLTRRKPDGD